MTIGAEGRIDLGEHGIDADGRVHVHPSTSVLYTHTLRRNEGRLAEGGPLVVDTGRHTGRSPKDKFLVREPGSEDRVWWGTVNQELDRKSTRLNSSHLVISYAVFCLKTNTID